MTISYDIAGDQARGVGVDITVADSVGVARVWLAVDGTEVDARKLDGVRSAPLRLKIPAGSLAVGMHLIVVYAVDAAGNRGSAAGDLEIK